MINWIKSFFKKKPEFQFRTKYIKQHFKTQGQMARELGRLVLENERLKGKYKKDDKQKLTYLNKYYTDEYDKNKDIDRKELYYKGVLFGMRLYKDFVFMNLIYSHAIKNNSLKEEK